MNCPTCDHTMHRVIKGDPVFWCPRCGTLSGPGGNADVPRLVERCRTFAGLTFADLGAVHGHLHRLGILEAVLRPAKEDTDGSR